jgi:hypothetical protein
MTRRSLDVATTIVLVVVGLTLATYGLTAFVQPEWQVAGPALFVAAAGVAGLRQRWAYLAGIAPIGAVMSVAGPFIAFDLYRPEETSYFVASVIVLFGSCAAAVLGLTSALFPEVRQRTIGALGVSVMVCVAIPLAVLSLNEASAATADGITASERAEADEVRLSDFKFEVDGDALSMGGVIRVHNIGVLPHNFTVPSLEIAVFVPSGRDTYVRLPADMPAVIGMICTISDHQLRGMGLNVEVR